ncbi:ribosomal RNA small subunit methyltransferase A [Candidatus Saccharibacteria bacterium]|nr:ribosomal RNA small subunit methyltransferase A [Candidatus Saccharibacteria bacterium]
MATNKALGQHWLKNRAILDEIAELAGEGSICLEIGPGLGTLTSSLLKRFDKVVAVEYDAELARKLPASFPGKNLEVLNEDFLKFDLSSMEKGYVVAGNIPYYITSPIIEKLLTAENMPSKIVLLMQKEVAERITSEKESVLSLFVKNRAEAELGPVVVAEEFTPPPKVDSQVLVMTPFENGPRYSDEIFKLIKMGFSAPRKKLTHNLAGMMSKEDLKQVFSDLEISVDARPADLSLEDWYNIYNKIYK